MYFIFIGKSYDLHSLSAVLMFIEFGMSFICFFFYAYSLKRPKFVRFNMTLFLILVIIFSSQGIFYLFKNGMNTVFGVSNFLVITGFALSILAVITRTYNNYGRDILLMKEVVETKEDDMDL